MKDQKTFDNPKQLLLQAPEHVRKIITRVLQLEADHLYLQKPRLGDDIIRIVEEEVK